MGESNFYYMNKRVRFNSGIATWESTGRSCPKRPGSVTNRALNAAKLLRKTPASRDEHKRLDCQLVCRLPSVP